MRTVCKSQGTAEWLSARAGICTASRMADAMSRLKVNTKNGAKGDWSADHRNYVSELAWEMITRMPADHYVSKAMDIGTQFEGEARIEYWMRYGTEVDETGFVLHPTLDWLGCSPDGLVGADGGLEIKVPLFHTHVRYLEADEIPKDYQIQMHCGMLCCERKWWDFVSYCPPDVSQELPEEFRIFRKRLLPDPDIFKQIEEAATATMEEAIAMVNLLRKRYPKGSVNRPERKPDNPEYATAEEAMEAATDAVMDSLAGTP